ncbi:MAG: hypothetical protein E7302_12610 [Butyrivibrio sp.]|nr:hypothetical protein [Butyrivibrio sp.]
MKKRYNLVLLIVTFFCMLTMCKMDSQASYEDNYPSYSRLDPVQSARYEQVVKEVLKGVNKKWSPEEKLFYLHDYIVTHTRYKVNYKNSANAYGCMVEHEAQCAGYALAFCDIANRMGIETQYIVGMAMNHAWNAVKLNGKWYYIDCTFDDQGTGYFSTECRHTNFLRNESGMRATAHTGKDWRHGHYGTQVTGRYTSATYEKAEWRENNQNRPFTCLSDGVVYLHTGSDGEAVYSYNCRRGRVQKIFEDPEISLNASFASKGKNFFVSGKESLFYYNAANKSAKKIYVLSDEESLSGEISSIYLKGNKLRYDIGGTGIMPKDEVRCGYLNVSKVSSMLVKELTLDKKEIDFHKLGDSETLTVTASGISSYTWESDNPGVAVVNNGVVTAVGRGGCFVSVSGDGVTAKCFIQVNANNNDYSKEPAKETTAPDTTWQNDFYNYLYKSSGEIHVSRYKGNARDLVIPATAVVDGKEYHTVMSDTLIDSKSSSTLNNLVTIKFEAGVKISGYQRIALNCPNLITIDLSGCDTTGVSGLDVAENCPQLSYVNLGGLDYSCVYSSYNSFENCPNLRMITTPRLINPERTIELPGEWRTKENNEWGNEAYKSLNKAPVNSTIYLYEETVQKGQTFVKDGITYRITDTVAGKASVKNITGKNVVIPSMVIYNGNRYLVSSIDKKAAQNNKNLESLTIGACVRSIGDNAFYKCSKLENIRVNSGVVTKIGKNAFKGTNSKMKIVVPKDMKITYTTMFKKAGCSKNTGIKAW